MEIIGISLDKLNAIEMYIWYASAFTLIIFAMAVSLNPIEGFDFLQLTVYLWIIALSLNIIRKKAGGEI